MRRLAERRLMIRVLKEGDMDAVVALQDASFKNPWSPELLKRELSHDWSTILGVFEESAPEALLGFAIFWLVHDELHILNVATDPRARRKGVARAALEEALFRAKARNCTLATLEVRKSNDAALELYRSLGFRAVGVRPNYYADEREDAIVMVKSL
jgi:[ribosomal protein S18]-alanine N-acetyltransferase